MLAEYPEFAEKFATVISIPVFTNDELVSFARTYARENGYRMDERCMGTYLHGILDYPAFLHLLFAPLAGKWAKTSDFDARQFKETQYDRLANHVRTYADMPQIYRILTTSTPHEAL